LPLLREDPLRFFTDLSGQYGHVSRFRVWHRRVVLLTHPEHARHVLRSKASNYTNASPNTHRFDVLRQFLGNGLLTSSGEVWLRQRRLMQPFFLPSAVSTYAQIVTQAAAAQAQIWDSGGAPVDVFRDMSRLTLRIVSQALIGVDVSAEADRVFHALSVAERETIHALTHPVQLPTWTVFARKREIARAVADLDHIVAEIIGSRRAAPRRDDLLSKLIAAPEPDGSRLMSDRQLRDEAITAIIAGHETTAVALAWTWLLLADHPHEGDVLAQEVDRVLGGRTPAVEDLPRLVHTTRVVKEALRLYPPIWVIPRYAIGNDTIGGYRIPAGSFVMFSIFATHRHGAFWDDPEAFQPSRFAGTWTDEDPDAFMPFGVGARQCIGSAFAIHELTLVIASLAQRGRLVASNAGKVGIQPSVTLRPAGPMTMMWRPLARVGLGHGVECAAATQLGSAGRLDVPRVSAPARV
jgi:cytochrome P450